MVELELLKMQLLSPCNSRRGSNASNSPEFEFWMLRNPSFPQPDLHSADELFSDGVLLPLHHLQDHSSDPPTRKDVQKLPREEQGLALESEGKMELHYKTHQSSRDETEQQLESAGNDTTRPETESGSSGPDISASISNLSTSVFTSSKRWKDIFKKSDKKCSNDINDYNNNNNNSSNNIKNKEKGKEKVKKKEKRSLVIGGSGNNVAAAAELNINIWPFRRSRSAGNSGNKPRTAATTRKVSSAPCSRSNSGGESKSRKWPSSPSRGGVHLGRTIPIWQIRRPGSLTAGSGGRSFDGAGKNAEKGTGNDENESGGKFLGAVTAATGSSGVASSSQSSDSALKIAGKAITVNEHDSRRKIPAADTCISGSGDGVRSFDGAGVGAEKGNKKDENESCRKFPPAVAGGSGGRGIGHRRVLSFNVPMCIGYTSRLGCRSDEHSAVSLASTATGGVSGGDSENDRAATMDGVRESNLFKIRSLFTKKVY